MSKRRAAFLTLGCKVNQYETDAMEEILEKAGYEIVSFKETADVYIINTCSVTNMADRKSRQMIHRAKKNNPDAIIVAAGCYVQAAEEELAKKNEADILVGNNKKKDIAQILEEYFAAKEPEQEVPVVSEVIDINHTKEYEDLMPMFKNMEKLRNILLEKRIKRGAIEFEFDEAKIILDENGKPIDIVKRERNVATSIIEEFMLAANETIAERFFWLELPFVYRTHEVPDEEKVEQLENFIGKMGYILKGNATHPKSFQKMLEQAKGKPEELLIHRMTLRSFKQARYTAENGKHFGLAATYYCHFTSPIRRYPDLQIHRIISQYLTGELTDKRISKYNRTLAQVALQCSINERKAEDAERETDKYKIVEYMQDKIGETFDGIISGVTSWGIYVELENTVEGMVSTDDLYDDYYIYDEDSMSYMGEHTHKTYTIGDKVKVTLVRASLIDRVIDFEFAQEEN